MQEGKAVRIIYCNNDNGYTVAILKTGAGEVKIAGHIYGLRTGDTIRYEGETRNNKKYGEQLEITRWEKPAPSTIQGVVDFLTSGLIKNVGPVRAAAIAKTLGAGALEIITSNGPDILKSVPGIGKRADSIYHSILENTALQTIIQELTPLGITPNASIKAYKCFGPHAGRIIKENPYRLIEIDGIGFHTADAIAIKCGISRKSQFRVQAALIHSLTEASMSGHCYLPNEELIKASLSVLNSKDAPEIISAKEAVDATAALLKSSALILDGNNIYLPQYYSAEKEIAEKISNLCRPVYTPNPGPAIKAYERQTGLTLAPEQKEAVESLHRNNVLILTGGPGTGKTETIRAVAATYKTLYPRGNILLASPTGRASRRLSEITGMSASTIHRLLGIQPGKKTEYDRENPLPCDLLIIDEVSMLDVLLARQLFQAISPETKVLLVGDKDQLPSVGPGNVLSDMLAAGVPAVYLSKIFRQAAQSQIVTNSHRVNSGNRIEIDPSQPDFFHIRTDDFPKAAELVRQSVLRLIQKGHTIDEIQVLSPMRKNNTGVIELNKALQEALRKSGAKELNHNSKLFRENDKVIQTKNNYEKDVFNGDVGMVEKIAPVYDDGVLIEKTALHVKYNGKTVTYSPDELDQLDLAYAITIHKSQGSEYSAVILVLTTQHYIMLARNLLYTAMTRAKEFFCLIGCDKALNAAIRNNAISKRNTSLAAMIKLKPTGIRTAG